MPACWQSSITNESIVYPQAEAENVSPVSFFSFSSFFFTTVKTGLCSPEGVFAMVSYGVDVSKGWGKLPGRITAGGGSKLTTLPTRRQP